MRAFRNIFAFTFKEAARKKSFIFSTVFGLVLILVLCALPMLLSGSGDNTGTPGGPAGPSDPGSVGQVEKKETLYLLVKGDFPNAVTAMERELPEKNVIVIAEDELNSAIETASASKNTAVVVLNALNEVPLVTANINSIFDESLVNRAVNAVERQWKLDMLTSEGVSEDVAYLAISDVPYIVNFVGKMDLTGYILGIIILCLMFFAIYFYGYGVALSIANEKTSRVMETLVVAAKPRDLFWGKCLAMGALGLAQLALFIAFGALGYHLLIPDDFLIMGMPLSLSAFTWKTALLVLVYFLLGYLLYVVMNAACGAMVSRAEDMNSALMPVMMISLLAFYLAYAGALSGSEVLSRISIWLALYVAVYHALPAAERLRTVERNRYLHVHAGGRNRGFVGNLPAAVLRVRPALRHKAQAAGFPG